ncbi:hypothetical protein HHK36_017750 [Tetracentron sinense]|uniref:Retrovirus-related Pol polyprotein from transposon TNT 1-94-like beta-barrel domain-containing protein n=1 Tax=Tetracentron sinense TaxID=13715 RepID=A0A835DCW1_TETSI|nr:hypothetical protein HHK36_017750 [Tetracentron sinense]
MASSFTTSALIVANIAHLTGMVSVKLNPKNFLVWKEQILSLVDGVDLQDHITGDHKKPKNAISSIDGTEVANPTYVTWRRHDRMLKSLLSGTMTEEVLTLTIGMETARDVWQYLETSFAASTKEREYNLIMFTQAAQGRGQYQFQPNAQGKAAGMANQPIGPTMGMQQNNLIGEQQVVCQICGKANYMTLNCWNRFNHSYQAEEIPQALAAMTVTDPHDLEWIPDTGASSHMTNNPGILNTVKPYMGHDKIIIGDGKELSISHVGYALLPTPHGNLPLSNVLLVPKITKNLLSVGQLSDDLSYIFEFSSDGFVIKDKKTGRILATKIKEGGIYALGAEKKTLYSRRQRRTIEEEAMILDRTQRLAYTLGELESENGRLRHIESIAKRFMELTMAHKGDVKVIVTIVIVSSTIWSLDLVLQRLESTIVSTVVEAWLSNFMYIFAVEGQLKSVIMMQYALVIFVHVRL